MCVDEVGAGVSLSGAEHDLAGISLSESCCSCIDDKVAVFGTSGETKSACVTSNGRFGGIEGVAGGAGTSVASSGTETELTCVGSSKRCAGDDGGE